jgi:predicted nucleic acid-binding protein
MTDRIVVDTDLLIDYLREHPPAISFLEIDFTGTQLGSTATIAELYGGVRDAKERTQLDLAIRAFEVIPVSAAIARLAGEMRRTYGKSHDTGIIDCMIAATAQLENAGVATLNRKHFPMVSVVTPSRKP